MLVDSGASKTIMKNGSRLHNLRSNTHETLQDAQGNRMEIEAMGDLCLQFYNSKVIEIETIVSPLAQENLLSVEDLVKAGYTPNFRERCIEDQYGTPVAQIVKRGSFYWLSSTHILPPQQQITNRPQTAFNVSSVKYSLDYVHRLFGHINVKSLRDSIKSGAITNIRMEDIDWTGSEKFQCEMCLKVKSTMRRHVLNSRLKYQKVYKPFEFFHTDLFGPVRVTNSRMPKYMIAFTDECTRFRWVFPLWDREQNSILEIFLELVKFIDTQLCTKVLAFQMDQGSEFTNDSVTHFLRKHGILPYYISVADSRSHGVAERTNRLLLDDCRTLLNSVSLPTDLWFYAVQFATLMRNTVISSSTKGSPRTKAGLTGLDARTILPFGQPVIVNNPRETNKLNYRGVPGVALCPSSKSFGYLVYVPSYRRQIVDTRNYVVLRESPNAQEEQIEHVISQLSAVRDPTLTDESSSSESTNNTTSAEEASTVESQQPDSYDPPDIEQNKPSGTTSGGTNDKPASTTSGGTNDKPASTTSGGTNSKYATANQRPGLKIIPSPYTSQSNVKPKSGMTQRVIKLTDSVTSDPMPNVKLPPLLTKGVKKATRLPPLLTIKRNVGQALQEPQDSSSSSSSSHSSVLGGGIVTEEDKFQMLSRDPLPHGLKRARNESKSQMESGTEGDDEDNSEEYQPPATKQRVNYAKASENPALTAENVSERPSLSYKEAISFNSNAEEKELFIIAYKKEIDQLIKMETWGEEPINCHIVPRDRIINSMFIFTTKRDGIKKCRFVARGDQQKPETYMKNLQANTVHNYALMTCMSIALDSDMFVTQMDISSAYLNADLKEELYIRTSPRLQYQDTVVAAWAETKWRQLVSDHKILPRKTHESSRN